MSVLLISSAASNRSAIGTFDYKDLNQYLLFATGSLRPDEEHLGFLQELATKAQRGFKIPVRDAKSLGTKEPFVVLPHTANLTAAVENFGGGIHRIVIVKEGTEQVIGVLSQLRLVSFLWENGPSFPVLEQLYHQSIKDLSIGSHNVIFIKSV